MSNKDFLLDISIKYFTWVSKYQAIPKGVVFLWIL